MFPNPVLPPCADPKELQRYSNTPLSEIRTTKPFVALQLFVFRLRRGEYRRWVSENFAYKPYNWLNSEQPTRWWTSVTSIFSHGGLFHFGFCAIAANSLISIICPVIGPLQTAGLFLGSGIGGILLDAGARKLLLPQNVADNPKELFVVAEAPKPHPVTGKLFMAKQLVPKPEYESMFMNYLGSSGGLMGMLTASAILAPRSSWQLMFIPIPIRAPYMVGGLVAWDLAGALGVWKDDIGHWGHLAGDVMGLLLYMVWLRRMPTVQIYKATSNRRLYSD